MLDRVDALTAQVEALTLRVEEVIAPFAHQVAQLDEVPGIGRTGAQELIAEMGVDMTRFATAGHLVSWAKYAPKAKQSAGRSKPGTTGKGNPWLAGTLGEAAMGASRTKTFLGSRYHRLARRRGKHRALLTAELETAPRQEGPAPRGGRLTQRAPNPAPLRSAGWCRAPSSGPIFDSGGDANLWGPAPTRPDLAAARGTEQTRPHGGCSSRGRFHASSDR